MFTLVQVAKAEYALYIYNKVNIKNKILGFHFLCVTEGIYIHPHNNEKTNKSLPACSLAENILNKHAIIIKPLK